MQAQEEMMQSYYYFQQKTCNDIDVSSRNLMAVWCQQLQKILKLCPGTASIAISLFDQYLSSDKGRSQEALQDRYMFQLAAIGSFFIAIKLFETMELDAVTRAELCHNYYTAADILSMEEDILLALNGEVICPTPMEFVRDMMELLPEKIDSTVSQQILETTQEYADHTTTDFFFAFCKPSVVGASCLASALTGSNVLSASERQAFWLDLGRIVDLVDVIEAQNKILEETTPSTPIKIRDAAIENPFVASRCAIFDQNKASNDSRSFSPACVSLIARQS
eukprot:CAMPEP_0183707280 /NCGR_PEP_ID=MMETSP0737-20130205/3894_1 /TAXON_ID=385413 /ORGANISM="Thalassiosira miniscula, Strain CCMP1093" /LENGTH=278 /DNA_ID=CAMNT_0025934897 /DNA_START=286 /DNA_END=1122 /DNA_ORIENTATION=+